MNLSNNQMVGTIANYPLDGFDDLDSIDLSSNQFEGPIPLFSYIVGTSYLSNNKFSSLNSSCDVQDDTLLSFLDISYNQLAGELPDSWSHFKRLEILILNNNKLSGKFPSSIGSLPRIQVLNLGNNNLTGELPSSLKKCTELTVLYVGENRLQGPVPSWMGAMKKKVSLKRNRYTLVDSNDNDTSITLPYNGSIRGYDAQVGLIWKGRLSQYKSTLRLVKSIDLSSNKLTGEIPTEITELIGLVSLNLSRNNLSGQIPRKIGQLKSLDALDLSRNHLYGKIPWSLSEVDRLNFLDLSSNKLSGKIPTGTQLQSFNSSTYMGNPELCGPPLERKCPGEESTTSTETKDEDGLISRGFYVSMGLGFVVGFWGLCGTLVFIKSWRYAYFKFLNSVGDRIFLMVKLQKA
ncbi:LRR domain containing protein [Trema orientale]|uniref:LRR domain containing protein n=1 Tax=Trema orientale TaxID=63057 RepID=A0A2P5FS68_TREOI|nr:LRR domain containing protein [Trema orientale]